MNLKTGSILIGGMNVQRNIIADKRFLVLIAVFLVVINIFVGCTNREPPSLEEMEDYWETNREDILLVTNFLMQQEGDVFIDYDGYSFESWFDVPIPDKIHNAVKRLRNTQRICVSKSENTIQFIIWIPPMTEIDSGLAFSINGTDLPSIAYATVITPLSESGWYYYVADFNEWRVRSTEQDIEY